MSTPTEGGGLWSLARQAHPPLSLGGGRDWGWCATLALGAYTSHCLSAAGGSRDRASHAWIPYARHHGHLVNRAWAARAPFGARLACWLPGRRALGFWWFELLLMSLHVEPDVFLRVGVEYILKFSNDCSSSFKESVPLSNADHQIPVHAKALACVLSSIHTNWIKATTKEHVGWNGGCVLIRKQ